MNQPINPALALDILRAISDPGNFPKKENYKGGDRTVSEWSRDAVVALLVERGHILPDGPPALEILRDAQQFAGQFTLALLVIRLQRLLATNIVITAETAPTKRWLSDYIDGRNHGPVGKPMFWPQNLKGLCQQLREWGYAPTDTHPPFVCRAISLAEAKA